MQERINIIFAAPHRLLFFTGVINLVFLMVWWTASLFDIYIWPIGMSRADVPASLIHGPMMLYLMIPAFFFGFLLTVFPRWMSYPDLSREQYAPVGTSFILASILAWFALILANHHLLALALCIAGLGWAAAIWQMLRLLILERRENKGPTWHAWSAFSALGFGLIGLCLAMLFLVTLSGQYYQAASMTGTFGFLLPVFFTVAHRMIPFFAGNVVRDYVVWRPYWVLAAAWIFLVTHLLLGLTGNASLEFISALALCLLTGLMLWRWWPRQTAPGLFMALIWGFAWAPLGFALIALDSYSDFAGLGISIGRAPVHALYIGMSGSLVIAMVTRVTQGHSGRTLEMSRIAWLAFWGIQLSAIARIIAGIRDDHGHWFVLAGVLWILLVSPWALRQVAIYLTKRADGKAG
ncbi:NnrS family protein [Parasphingorhabdus sp.]|uniref:NnrS family protein n=1 Tax=Parasphingorhabdus sp. TaxID=2709688 RepID=UPI003A932451